MEDEVWLTDQNIGRLLEQQGIPQQGKGVFIEMGIISIMEVLKRLPRDVALELEMDHGIAANPALVYSSTANPLPVISLKMLRALLISAELTKLICTRSASLDPDLIQMIYQFVITAMKPDRSS